MKVCCLPLFCFQGGSKNPSNWRVRKRVGQKTLRHRQSVRRREFGDYRISTIGKPRIAALFLRPPIFAYSDSGRGIFFLAELLFPGSRLCCRVAFLASVSIFVDIFSASFRRGIFDFANAFRLSAAGRTGQMQNWVNWKKVEFLLF